MAAEGEPRVPGHQPGDGDAGGGVPAELLASQTALLEYATELLLMVTFDGELVAGAGAGLGALGADAMARRGHHIAEQIHPDDLIRTLDLIERARSETDFDEVIEVRAKILSEEWNLVEARVIAVVDHEVLGTGAVIRARALRAAVETPEVASESDDRFLSLAAELESGVLSADARGWVVYANDRAQQILAMPLDDLAGHGWLNIVREEDRDDIEDVVQRAVTSRSPLQATFRASPGGPDSDGERWFSIRAAALDPSRRTGWVGILDDVTNRHRADARLAHQATHDPLTGLPNRSLLDDRLAQACARQVRDGDSLAVLFVDLDRFKEVNDTRGHAAGDVVLRSTAKRLVEGTRPADTVARLGGDEFVVVLEGMDALGAARLATVLTNRIREPIDPGGADPSSIRVEASIGVAVATGGDINPEGLLAVADSAMYRVKRRRSGRP